MLGKECEWVAVTTQNGREQLVVRELAEAEAPIECYLPMMIVRDRRRKATEQSEKPMFSGYIFAKINKNQIYQVRTARHVHYIVSANHSIITMPQRDIDAIKAFEQTRRSFFIRETSELVRGKEATIMTGEFAGQTGRLVKASKDGNFCVEIKLLGKSFLIHAKRIELTAPRPQATEQTTETE